jgi:hypothetical protein
VLDVDDAAVRGAALAMKAADRDLRRDIGRATQAVAVPVWRAEIARRVVTRQDARMYGPGTVTRGNPPALVVAQSSRPLSGGLVPRDDWPNVEFGSNRAHGRRGQLPRNVRSGRVAFPAVAAVAPRLVSAWVGTIFRGYAGRLGVG